MENSSNEASSRKAAGVGTAVGKVENTRCQDGKELRDCDSREPGIQH